MALRDALNCANALLGGLKIALIVSTFLGGVLRLADKAECLVRRRVVDIFCHLGPLLLILCLQLLLPLQFNLFCEREFWLGFDEVLYVFHHVLAVDLRLPISHHTLPLKIRREVLFRRHIAAIRVLQAIRRHVHLNGHHDGSLLFHGPNSILALVRRSE